MIGVANTSVVLKVRVLSTIDNAYSIAEVVARFASTLVIDQNSVGSLAWRTDIIAAQKKTSWTDAFSIDKSGSSSTDHSAYLFTLSGVSVECVTLNTFALVLIVGVEVGV